MALRQPFRISSIAFAIELILFTTLLFSCQNPKPPSDKQVQVLWEQDQSVGIRLDGELSRDSLFVFLKGNEDQAILGRWQEEAGDLLFYPVVPFTAGMSYQIRYGKKLVDTFQIRFSDHIPPSILTIYPTSDTVPENLLKMYIQFSQPMGEENPLAFISVLDKTTGDTLEGTFLDLQPPLWNLNNTMLTLWLDPGRIKRDLIPNKMLGTPLQLKHYYQVRIFDGWRDQNGLALSSSTSKEFFTSERDALSPRIDDWDLVPPTSETREPLQIIFKESLDAILIREAITVLDPSESIKAGKFEPGSEERTVKFYPEDQWETGEYLLVVESRLEDLAGNNLNRLFDQEMGLREEKEPGEYRISFKVE